jgi:hypothetical protein
MQVSALLNKGLILLCDAVAELLEDNIGLKQ